MPLHRTQPINAFVQVEPPVDLSYLGCRSPENDALRFDRHSNRFPCRGRMVPDRRAQCVATAQAPRLEANDGACTASPGLTVHPSCALEVVHARPSLPTDTWAARHLSWFSPMAASSPAGDRVLEAAREPRAFDYRGGSSMPFSDRELCLRSRRGRTLRRAQDVLQRRYRCRNGSRRRAPNSARSGRQPVRVGRFCLRSPHSVAERGNRIKRGAQRLLFSAF